MEHYLIRTNPKGQSFIGKCKHCGEEGGFALMKEFCSGPPHSPEDDLLDALKGGE